MLEVEEEDELVLVEEVEVEELDVELVDVEVEVMATYFHTPFT